MTGQRQNNQYSLALWAEGPGAARSAEEQGIEPVVATTRDERPAEDGDLMEAVCSQANVLKAWKHVRGNKGSPGIDGLSIEATAEVLRRQWPAIRSRLLAGTYRPQPVLRVNIPKPGGGFRSLGVPCVVDRLIQQAVLQVLQPRWDPTFSAHSYGFRPGRSAHQAVAKAQQYVADGYAVTVDIDLEKFFDRVNQDRLMARIAHRESDRRLLRLIRAFLNAGVLEHGGVQPTVEGTPQGGPLSPLLSNLVLDELDKELERRGLRFCRYADDCNIYVRSHRAGERVMASVSRFLTRKLRLTVNESKSAVDCANRRQFLGFRIIAGGRKRGLAPKAIQRFKRQVRVLTRRTRGISLTEMVAQVGDYLRGWYAYFGFCQTPWVLGSLDSWVRRRLRAYQWRQWRRGRRRFRELRRRGLTRYRAAIAAGSQLGPWRMARLPAMQEALPSRFFDAAGLPRLRSRQSCLL